MSDSNRNDSNKTAHSAPPLGEFETRLQNALRASADALDGRTRSKLTQARHAALSAAKPWWTIASFFKARWWIPAAGGATAAAVLAVVLSVDPSRFNGPSPFNSDAHRGASVFEDLEMVSSDDSLELYQNMDFYAWLDSENSEDWTPSEWRGESGSMGVS